MADLELIVPTTTIVNTPIGVVEVTPPFVQPVVVTGSVTVVQPITIAQPVEVFPFAGAPTNIYGQAIVPFNIETNIISYTVPATHTFNIADIEMWGDYFAEYFIRVDGIQVSGTNVSAAERSKTLILQAPELANAGQVITVSVQHQAMGSVKFHANLMGGLV